jgi:hypothetical protein
MKDNNFERALLGTDDVIKRGRDLLINNVGKTVAPITLLLACLVTFTDISFYELGTERFTSTLVMMLIASYLMYFSLEDAGERLGEESEEFKEAAELYQSAVGKIRPEEIDTLRDYLARYSDVELDFRRRSYITAKGFALAEYESYRNGRVCDKRARRVFRQADRMRVVPITPGLLLDGEAESSKSELLSPQKGKLTRLIFKLIPSTVGMIFTATVMLGTKDGLTASTVIESILRLVTLPIVGFRGYSLGYSYAKCTRSSWIKTKTRIIDAYLTETSNNHPDEKA